MVVDAHLQKMQDIRLACLVVTPLEPVQPLVHMDSSPCPISRVVVREQVVLSVVLSIVLHGVVLPNCKVP